MCFLTEYAPECTYPEVIPMLVCTGSLNKTLMLPLLEEGIALEITPTLCLTVAGYKYFSTVLFCG
jgi:hypothetical protein